MFIWSGDARECGSRRDQRKQKICRKYVRLFFFLMDKILIQCSFSYLLKGLLCSVLSHFY